MLFQGFSCPAHCTLPFYVVPNLDPTFGQQQPDPSRHTSRTSHHYYRIAILRALRDSHILPFPAVLQLEGSLPSCQPPRSPP